MPSRGTVRIRCQPSCLSQTSASDPEVWYMVHKQTRAVPFSARCAIKCKGVLEPCVHIEENTAQRIEETDYMRRPYFNGEFGVRPGFFESSTRAFGHGGMTGGGFSNYGSSYGEKLLWVSLPTVENVFSFVYLRIFNHGN